MGTSRWNPSDWSAYSASAATKTRDAIFTARCLNPTLDPKAIPVRESVDSPANPQATPIIVALDVTGSMGAIPEALIKSGLGVLVEEILARKPVPDPHLMFMAVGDAAYDRAPLQVTQFEADNRIIPQLADLFLEGGGGGNSHESYHLPWYFAAMRTRHDALLKRGRKGYLFTLGDEEPPTHLLAAHAKAVLGDDLQADLPVADVLAMVERNYHVYHVIIEQGSHYRSDGPVVLRKWRDLLGQRVIPLADYERLAEVLVSTIALNEGADRDHLTRSWSGDTGLVVAHALKGLASPAPATAALARF